MNRDHFTLDRESFRHLVRGGTLSLLTDEATGDSVQIVLADLGFGVMQSELNYARNQPQLTGRIQAALPTGDFEVSQREPK